MTRLQIALDTYTMEAALRPLAQSKAYVDVIECGTILILSQGMRAVSEIRALYPEATILADVRIAEAGSKIAKMCFEAGASWVSCVAGASLTTIEQVVKVARQYGGQVQVELGETYDINRAKAWADLGVEHVIVKRSRDLEAAGSLSWSAQDIQRVRELHDLGFTVTVTGGIKHGELSIFAGAPVGVVIAGRSILEAEDPRDSARRLREEITEVFGE